MRGKTTTQDDSAAGLKGGVPWHVVEAAAVSDHALRVRFADGTRGEVDLEALLGGDSPGVFAALCNPAVFRQVRIEHGAVTWPGGVDLAPDAMYDDIRRTGRFIAG
jgi:hypothetical protein